jgi:hypothetical protein
MKKNKSEANKQNAPTTVGSGDLLGVLPDTGDDSLCNVRRLRAEIKWLRGIIARNATQRLKGEDAAEMYVTANDIRDSLEILYTWQRTETPNEKS